MTFYHWQDAPAEIHVQVQRVLNEILALQSKNLLGFYLHGSLAMGCFNPQSSDIDLLAVTQKTMRVESKRRICRLLLNISNTPAPLEISFLRLADIHPWQYPTPYDFHYGESWRFPFARQLTNGEWRAWSRQRQTDEDLAAHLMVARQRGICLWGRPLLEAFPVVPDQDIEKSLRQDIVWALAQKDEKTGYLILNLCRIIAWLKEKLVFSKKEGAEWMISYLPQKFHSALQSVLQAYEEGRGNLFQYREEHEKLLSYLLEQAG